MKNLKKVLFLGALLSAMSTMAMGATNPGGDMSQVGAGSSASAGVPMEVRVNILSQGPMLVLVDENGSLIDNLVLDHGTKVLTEDGKIARESKVEKMVIMKRADGKAFNSEQSGVTGYTAKFTLENANIDTPTKKFILTKLNSDGATIKTMQTSLEFLNEDIDVLADAKEVKTPVVSTIQAGTSAEAGLYIGTGTFVGTLTADN